MKYVIENVHFEWVTLTKTIPLTSARFLLDSTLDKRGRIE